MADEGGSAGFLSTRLIGLATQQLRAGYEDRETSEFVSSTNHYTVHALGCVPLLIGGLESTVNALIWFRVPRSALSLISPANQGRRVELETLLRAGTVLEKYRWLADDPDAQMTELVTLVAIRDDIVHGIPAMTKRGRPPPYLRRLEKHGLFLGAAELPDGAAHFFATAKLCSFKLAWWAFEVVEVVLESLKDRHRVMAAKLTKDLAVLKEFRTVPRPESMPPIRPA